jgi:hypothetical protein
VKAKKKASARAADRRDYAFSRRTAISRLRSADGGAAPARQRALLALRQPSGAAAPALGGA